MTAIVFPGQGSQYIGMSKDFIDNFQIARELLDHIQEYTSINIKDIILNDPDNKLNQTNITQLAIFTCSLIIYKVLESETSFSDENVNSMLGHSLGEYTSLAARKKLNIKESSIILKKRGELMNSAVKPNLTSMAAIIGLNSKIVSNIISENKLDIEIANDNSPMQIVISGFKQNIVDSEVIFKKHGAKKFVLLNVSAAFHSKFMLKAQNELKSYLKNLQFKPNDIKIISNFNADISNDNKKILYALENQMANRVNWVDSILALEKENENKIIEIGPGKVLSGLIKRISSKFDIVSINEITDLSKI